MSLKFTKLGELFYRHIRRNYVQVPVDVRGTSDNGTHYTCKTYFPITKLGLTEILLPLILTEAQRLVRVKQMVLTRVPNNGVIYEQSRETYHVDEHGIWNISEESVHTNAAGRGTTELVMDRRVGAIPINSQFLFFRIHLPGGIRGALGHVLRA